MLAAAGADAVMIGRGAVGRPWMVGQIAQFFATGKLGPAPSFELRRRAALTHYRTLLSLFGIEQGLRHARKHLAAYAEWAGRDGSRSAASLRLPLVTSENPLEVERLLSGIFDHESVLKAA
jgi:tRNA-dihydrouridine synthase